MKWIIVAVVFLTPLLFSPWTFDFFELPKQVLLWTAAAVLLVLWLFGFVLENEVRIIKTPLDLPLLLFVLVATVSTVLSSSRYTSLVGFFGRSDGGLAGLLAYVIIFYVAASRFRSIKDCVSLVVAFLMSTALLALLAIFYFFSAFILPWNVFNVRTFSPAGGVYAVTMVVAMAVPLALGLLVHVLQKGQAIRTNNVMDTPPSETTKPSTKLVSLAPLYSILVTIALILYIGVIALLGSNAAWLTLAASLVVFFLWSKRGQLRRASLYLGVVGVAALFWIALTTIGPIRQNISALKTPVEKPPTLAARESWFVAGNTIRDLPFLGSGPATFLFDFTRYRSASFNLSEDWNLRYMVAHNQYLQTLATMGVFGLLTYLFLLFRVSLYGFRTALVNRETEVYPLKVAVFAGIVAFILGTTLQSSTTTVMFTLFVLLAVFMALERISGAGAVSERRLAFVLAKPGQTEDIRAANAIPVLLFIPGLLVAVAALFFTAQYVRANTYYVRGVNTLQSNQPNAALDGLRMLERATQINRYEDGYNRDLAKTSFNLALALSAKENLADEDKQNVARLLQISIAHAQRAATISPLNVNNWQTLADIYRRIAGQVRGAGDVALQAFSRAIQTDPPNPQFFLDVGGIFFAANAYDQAIDSFKRAVELKPNLANARYNLANAYVKKEDYNNAYVQYQLAKQILASLPDTEPNKKQSLETLDKEIAAIQDKVQVAGTATESAQPQTAATPQPTPANAVGASPKGSVTPSASATPFGRSVTPTATPLR